MVVMRADAYDNFGAKALFRTPYYRDSWCLYKEYLSENLVEDFEKLFDLDPMNESVW